jgi:ABC-2 type transport system permease protein
VTATTGAVYDRGYRPYEGDRGGRNAARLALLRLSIRRALGLRRSWRQKVFPWTLLGLAMIPAVVQVGVGYLTRDSPLNDFEFITYRDYVGVSTTLLLFVALTAPDIVCPDRRHRVLPLIFARPLTGNDYVASKVGGLAFILFGFSFLPQVLLFIGQVLVADDGALQYFKDNAEVLWQVPLAVAVLALHYACIGIALSATTSRRVVAGVAILAVALVTSAVAGIVSEVQAGVEGASAWMLVNVLALPLHVRDLIFLGHIDPEGDLAGVQNAGLAVVVESIVIVAACLLYLRHRYKEVLV